MALLILGMLVGPIVGPTIGGFLSAAAGWRWIFWLLTILSAAVTGAGFFVLRETYPPVLLRWRAERLRRERPPHDAWLVPAPAAGRAWRPRGGNAGVLRAMMRPLKLLFGHPVSFILAVNMAVVYGIIYLILATLALVFQELYRFSENISGLAYIGVGLATAVALLALGRYNDILHNKLTQRNGGLAKPEYVCWEKIYSLRI